MKPEKTILELILDELKEMRHIQNEQNITLAKQNSTLEEHTRRSEALEELVKLTREEIKPIQKHVHYVEGALKLIGILSLLLGVAVAIKELIS